MVANGLLLLTSSTRCVLSSSRLKYNLLAASNRLAAGVLYVYHWFPPVVGSNSTQSQSVSNCPTEDLASQISRYSLISTKVYCQAQRFCPRLDIRFLFSKSLLNARPDVPIDLVLVEMQSGQENLINQSSIKNFVSKNFRVSSPDFEIQFIESDSAGTDEETSGTREGVEGTSNMCYETRQTPFTRLFDKVALGGTFDRMHIAHKILISEAVLRCNKELIIGVTDDNMIKNKLLYELIEPCDRRLERVNNFLKDISPEINARVVPINDAFGPTIAEEDIEFLVLSNETIRGGEKINEIRRSNNFPPLEVHSIKLYEEPDKQSEHEEDKISSSSQRIRILGDRLKPPRKSPCLPYIIGLTGGICSGKSTLCSYLATLGIPEINCDQLGHEAYKKGTQCFQQVVQTFGEDVLSGDEINRRALGAKVFANPEELSKLNGIVWPEIRRLILERIQVLTKQGAKAVVLDAAVLLEAKWDELCHDVWVVIIPKEEAIKRVQQRDQLSKEDAERRILSQVSNHERVKRATFVFSSFWEHDFTRRQAHKAWLQIKSVIDSLT